MEIAAISRSAPLPCDPPKEISAIHRFHQLMQEFINLAHEHRRELSRMSEEHREEYTHKTEQIKGLMDAKGWTGLELGIAAAALAAVSPFVPSDSLKKLLEAGSHLMEGIKPAFNAWDDAKLLPEHTQKDYLENQWRQALDAVRQNKDWVPSLLHLVEKTEDAWGETRYD